MNGKDNIQNQAISSIKWVYLITILQQSIRPLTIVILARFLTPDDFGIIGMSTIVLSLANLFGESGISQAVIQIDSKAEAYINVGLVINFFFSLLLMLLVIVSAPYIGKLFNESRIIPVLRVQSLSILFVSCASIHNALLRKQFKYRRLFILTTIPLVIPLLVAVPFAIRGYGYWALVFSSVIGSGVSLFLHWTFSDWRPAFKFDLNIALQLIRFSKWTIFNGIIGWVMVQGDRFFIGMYLNVRDLGIYTFSRNCIDLVSGFLVQPIFNVIYPYFCRLAADRSKLKIAYEESLQIISVIVFPVAVGLCIITEPLIPVIFGENWIGIEPFFALLALLSLSWISCINPEVYKAIGKPGVMYKFDLGFAIISLIIYWISVRYGLMSFVIGKLFGLFSIVLHAWVIKRVLNFKPAFFWKRIKSAFFATLFMGICVYFSVILMGPYEGFSYMNAGKLSAIIFVGIVCYLVSLLKIDRQLVFKIFSLTKNASRF